MTFDIKPTLGLICLLGLGLPAMSSQAKSSHPDDSVRVVKGQVSDYYIPINTSYVISGKVTDEQGRPIEGATVMFFASPLHCNTNARGYGGCTSLHPCQ